MIDHTPRDLVGYGANPPQVQWPKSADGNPAKVALQIVGNYEEGGEKSYMLLDLSSCRAFPTTTLRIKFLKESIDTSHGP